MICTIWGRSWCHTAFFVYGHHADGVMIAFTNPRFSCSFLIKQLISTGHAVGSALASRVRPYSFSEIRLTSLIPPATNIYLCHKDLLYDTSADKTQIHPLANTCSQALHWRKTLYWRKIKVWSAAIVFLVWLRDDKRERHLTRVLIIPNLQQNCENLFRNIGDWYQNDSKAKWLRQSQKAHHCCHMVRLAEVLRLLSGNPISTANSVACKPTSKECVVCSNTLLAARIASLQWTSPPTAPTSIESWRERSSEAIRTGRFHQLQAAVFQALLVSEGLL